LGNSKFLAKFSGMSEVDSIQRQYQINNNKQFSNYVGTKLNLNNKNYFNYQQCIMVDTANYEIPRGIIIIFF